jgi:predicted aspartyl protease
MNRMQSILFAAAILCCLAKNITGARADDCPQLQMVASVPMSYDEGGHPAIPVTLGTTQKLMLVDTGGALSEIGQHTVDELGLTHISVPIQQYGVSGNYTDKAAEVSPFKIGNLVAKNMQFMINPDKSEFSGDVVGVIGPTILRNYDADFDFGTNKFNLMLQDHCPGHVIYWPAAGVAVIPMRVAKSVGHIVVPVTLDGIKFNATIDTGSPATFMTTRVAESDFGLKLNTPEAPDIGGLGGQSGARVYRHTFHSLSLEGIAINNPEIEIIPDLNRSVLSKPPELGSRISNNDEAPSLEDITIGMDVLKRLHVYIAYKEQVLYVTPAESAPAPPAHAAPAH